MPAPLWTPSEKRLKDSNLHQFMRYLKNDGHKFNSYQALHDFSVQHSERFWDYVWKFGSFIQHQPHTAVLEKADKMPGAKWFPNATLNFAENLLKFRDERPALVFYDERGKQQALTYQQLYHQVIQLSTWLKSQGIKSGDRVAGFMPNMPQTIVAMLATTSLGAVWSSCSPDFGIQGVLDRFGQIKPKVLLTTDGYFYNKKTLDSLDRVNAILESLSDIEQLIVVPYVDLSLDKDTTQRRLTQLPSTTQLTIWTSIQENALTDEQITSFKFEAVPFDHPLYIMYSSGTTGVPKCIVHGVGGTLIQHYKELVFHTDLNSDDSIFYYTTCGWMMWNWLVSSLMTGAKVVLFDGSPFSPNPNVLWDLAEKENVSVFGTSAKYIAALEKAGVKPRESHQLPALKAVLSTGSPLAHESFDYVYRDIKQDVCLSSISGGTDIISCFALGSPTLPVYRGELQCTGLGMSTDIYNDQGESVVGEKGELVCTKPFPSMPIGFWNDENGEKYFNAYFAQYDNIWAHGDYAERVPHLDNNAFDHHGVIIHGRSDAVLNPGGVRIGTAEIYRQVEKVDAVLESIAIGQEWKDDVRVILFVILREGVELDDALIDTIKTTIRSNTTPRHVPAKIIQVADIPRTISGKIVELAVRNIVHNQPVKNTDALKNPEALSLFKDIEALKVT